ncbi:MAG: polymer-forming cytoskeletal protein [Spirochaetales bacterium]|nr:polymer-forming cytoskeletal protein [Spirochaetales bacterium]
MAKASEQPNCIIGEGSVFEGKFQVRGSIQIDGKFQGEINTDEHLLVGSTGRVKTDIIAKKVTIAGTLIGNIHATEEVELLQSGKVLGNISTPQLHVEDGVVTHGEVKITAKNTDDIKKYIEDSYGKETEEEFKTITRQKKASAQKAEE